MLQQSIFEVPNSENEKMKMTMKYTSAKQSNHTKSIFLITIPIESLLILIKNKPKPSPLKSPI